MKRLITIAAVAASLSAAAPAIAGERQVGSWTVVETTDPILKQPWVTAVINNNSDGTAFRIGCTHGKAHMLVWTHRHRYFALTATALVGTGVADDSPTVAAASRPATAIAIANLEAVIMTSFSCWSWIKVMWFSVRR
jgi:hypothetical protein